MTKHHYKKKHRWGKREENLIKAGSMLLLIALLLAIHLYDPSFYPTVWRLSRTGDFNGTVEYLRSFGVWAMGVSFLIDVLINIVGFLPSIFLSAANGVVFGIGMGILISWLGETVGVIISFWLMRTLFHDMAQKVIEKNKMLSKLDEYSTLWAMAVARALPYSPNGLVTALGAVSSISYRDYIIGCLIGKLPSVAVEVLIGHDVVHADEHLMRLTLVVIGVTVVYGILWWFMRKKKKREKEEKLNENKE